MLNHKVIGGLTLRFVNFVIYYGHTEEALILKKNLTTKAQLLRIISSNLLLLKVEA